MQGRGIILSHMKQEAYNTAATVDEFVKEELKKNLSDNSEF